MGVSEPSPEGDYPWYKVVDETQLAQGDFLTSLPIVIFQPPFEPFLRGEPPNTVVRTFHAIIMTQSCDLFPEKTENVLVCPHFLPEEIEGIQEAKSKGGRARIQKGAMPSLHVLPPCSIVGHESDCRIVNFRQVASVPLGLVQAHVEVSPERLRLLPPYREQMAQAFGRFVMRVGLPVEFEIE
jgi:hypothetical protein